MDIFNEISIETLVKFNQKFGTSMVCVHLPYNIGGILPIGEHGGPVLVFVFWGCGKCMLICTPVYI